MTYQAQEYQTEVWFCDICGKKNTFNEDTGRSTGCMCHIGIDVDLYRKEKTDGTEIDTKDNETIK